MDRELWGISSRLFRARAKAGRSQEHVALEANLAVRTYRRLETGFAGSSLDSLLRAMTVLSVDRIDIRRTPNRADNETPGVAGECAACHLRSPGRDAVHEE